MSTIACGRCKQKHSGRTKTCKQCLDYIAGRRKHYKEAGICTNCKAEPCVLGKTECEGCLEFNSKRRALTLRARRSNGLCATCERPSDDYVCTKCKKRKKVIQKRELARRKAEEVCRYCRKAATVPDKTGCQDCLDERAEYQRQRLASDVKREQHRRQREARMAARKAAGICIFCKEPAAPYVKCEAHRGMEAARYRLKQMQKKAEETRRALTVPSELPGQSPQAAPA